MIAGGHQWKAVLLVTPTDFPLYSAARSSPVMSSLLGPIPPTATASYLSDMINRSPLLDCKLQAQSLWFTYLTYLIFVSSATATVAGL